MYCAHDSIYAEGILRAFEARTGIPVAVRYDTEATKSLGLVEMILQEKAAPRCDVFWNNEVLGTMRLQKSGVLHPYKGPGFNRIPASFEDPDGYWVGFAARLRVWIVNSDRLRPNQEAVDSLLAGRLDRVAIAKPLYGTTFTQYCILWNLWGERKLKSWHRDCRARGIREVAGNAQVRSAVAEGACDLGYTDSDDFFVAKDDGKPVAMLPMRLEDGRTICIPNTVSIIEGTRRPAEASQARGLPALPGDRGRTGESEIPADSSRPGERGGLARGSGPNEGLGGGGLSLVGLGERSGSLPGLVESRVRAMSLTSECGYALIRAFAVAVAALIVGHSVRDLIAAASRRGRAVAWFLLLTPSR